MERGIFRSIATDDEEGKEIRMVENKSENQKYPLSMKVIIVSRHFFKSHPNAGLPTYFVEKIFKSLSIRCDDKERIFDPRLSLDKFAPKHHTIRAGERLKVGDKISLRCWSGKPYRSKQIIIAETEVKQIYSFEVSECEYLLNGRKLDLLALTAVAKNDGSSADDFETWFGKKFKGQIICWSDAVVY